MIGTTLATWINEYLFAVEDVASYWPNTQGISVHLYIGDPLDDGVEPASSKGYNAIVTLPTDWIVTYTQIYNSKTILFDEALEAWGTITHAALYGIVEGELSTMFFSGPLVDTVYVEATRTPRFFTGALMLQRNV